MRFQVTWLAPYGVPPHHPGMPPMPPQHPGIPPPMIGHPHMVPPTPPMHPGMPPPGAVPINELPHIPVDQQRIRKIFMQLPPGVESGFIVGKQGMVMKRIRVECGAPGVGVVKQ